MSDDEEDEDDVEVDEHVIIMDNGSGICKAGLSDEQSPKFIFPEIVGREHGAKADSEWMFGDKVIEAIEAKKKLEVVYPIENGFIEDFDKMELLWEHTMCEMMGVNPEKHSVLLTEPPQNPKPNREKMVECMFETFGVPELNISIQGVLSLLAQGRTTGLVVDCGEGMTNIIPIYEGFGQPMAINRLELGGRELNTLLAKLLSLESHAMCTTFEQHHVRQMKEQHCYCSLDPGAETAEEATYKMPDGKDITLGDVRWKCPEALFSPSLCGIESMGVGGLVWDSVTKSEIDLRKSLLSNVVLSGGSTMFKGFKERLLRELKNFAPAASQAGVRIAVAKEPLKSVWQGAQVLSGLKDVQADSWVTYEDYEEYGASYIHDKVVLKHG